MNEQANTLQKPHENIQMQNRKICLQVAATKQWIRSRKQEYYNSYLSIVRVGQASLCNKDELDK